MNLTKPTIFLILCLSFCVGVFLGRFLDIKTIAILAMVFIILIVFGWLNKLLLVMGVAGLVMLVGALRFQQTYFQNDIYQFYGRTVAGRGIISEEPDTRLEKTYLTVSNIKIAGQELRSKVLLSVPLFPEYEYGQQIQFKTKLHEPKEYEDFSYKNYLSRFGIDAVAYQPEILLEPESGGNRIKQLIFALKARFLQNLNQVLPEPQAAFMGGLLLGAKRAIPEEISEQFKITGTSHIVAISGYNITVIAISIAAALAYVGLNKKFAFPLSVISIIAFVVMTGAQPSVVRAGFMGVLLLLAVNLGRAHAINNILAFSAATMLFINPQVLHFDIGFQLSFTAFLGLVYFTPIIEPYFQWVPGVFRSFLLATLSAQIFTLPILLFNFGLLSIIAPLVNVIVLVVIPATMLAGFLTGFLGFFSVPISHLFSMVAWGLLTYILKVVEFSSQIPFATVDWKFNVISVVVYYVCLIIFLRWYYQKHEVINPILPWSPKPENS